MWTARREGRCGQFLSSLQARAEQHEAAEEELQREELERVEGLPPEQVREAATGEVVHRVLVLEGGLVGDQGHQREDHAEAGAVDGQVVGEALGGQAVVPEPLAQHELHEERGDHQVPGDAPAGPPELLIGLIERREAVLGPVGVDEAGREGVEALALARVVERGEDQRAEDEGRRRLPVRSEPGVGPGLSVSQRARIGSWA